MTILWTVGSIMEASFPVRAFFFLVEDRANGSNKMMHEPSRMRLGAIAGCFRRQERRAFAGSLAMLRFWLGWVVAGWAVVGITRAADHPAPKTPPEEVLKKLGLSPSHSAYVLEAEGEVKKKMAEVRSLYDRLSSLHNQQAAFQENAAEIQMLTEQTNMVRQAINETNAQMSGYNSGYRGRFARYNPLQIQRNELNMNLNALNQQINYLKSQKPSPQKTKELDTEVEHQQSLLSTAAQDLRELVDSTLQKYNELAGNEQIKAALDKLGHEAHVNFKLGPSREFHETVKQLEKVEKLLKVSGKDSPSHSRRGSRRAKRAKPSTQ
jgi:archaellum component FlaC